MTPLPRTAVVLLKTPELSGPCHSALKLGPRTIAVCGTAIFSVAIRLENTTICQYSVKNLSADFSKIVKSISRHLHREVPCLMCHIFLMRDLTSLKLTRSVLFRPKLYTNGLSWDTISWYYTFKARPLLVELLLTTDYIKTAIMNKQPVAPGLAL
jgi:hypothetical protein